jgi:D-alanyl-D-alanine carboxypeptidase
VGSFDESRCWTPTELVQWAVDHEPGLRFQPGTQWEYSNTNFILLGLVIEAATGSAYPDQVADRLTGPLGLNDTYLAGCGDDNPRIVTGHDEAGADISGATDPSYGWAAGALVTTPRDLARWGAALYGGDVLPAEMLRKMITVATLPDGTATEYGLGTFVESDDTNAIYGHGGGIGGFLTYMYLARNESVALVAMTNIKEVDMRTLAGYGWSIVMGFEFP